MEIENQSSGDVSQESSSPAQSTDSTPSEAGSQSQAQNQTSTESSNVPFHEHPRWKELMEERNQFRNSSSELQKRLEAMEGQLRSQPKTEDPKSALLQRLKGIDPEFGGTFEEMYNKAMKAESVEKQLQEFQANQTRQAALNSINTLHESNKVAKELRPLYEAQIRDIANSDPRIGLQDLPRIYNQVHSALSQVIESVKRAERESYAKAKAADSKVPSSQPRTSAKPAASSKKEDYSTNRDEARSQVISRAVQAIRAQKAENS